jgi:hypothetical protein
VNQSRATDNIFAEGVARRVQGEAEARLQPPPPPREGAEAHLAESVRLFEAGDARLEIARTHVAWGKVAQARGDLEAAREHFEQAAAQFEASGLEHELNTTRTLLAAATDSPVHPEGARQT